MSFERLKKWFRKSSGSPWYSPAELALLRSHVNRYFGTVQSVYRGIAPHEFPVDIWEIPPTPEHPYRLWATCGMGTWRMNVPDNAVCSRIELLIALPPDWKTDRLDELDWGWPFNVLKFLADYPAARHTYLGYGHVVVNDGGALAPSTRLSGVILECPYEYPPEAWECMLNPSGHILFLQVVPLYPEELEYKRVHGTAALETLLGETFSMVVDPVRRNCAIWQSTRENAAE